MIELIRPWALLVLPLPFLAWRLLPLIPAPSAILVPAGVRDLLLRLTPEGRHRARRWPPGLGLRMLGWTALVVALAGPYTRGEFLEKPTGRDLVVAIDLSASMDESDMILDGQTVSRFRVVRDLIGKFIARRRGDRVGLIVFGHEAFLVVPLTFDTGAVASILDELVIGLSGHRTDLGRAVGLTVQTLRDETKATRVLVILSDGEDNSGALTGLDAARMAAANGVKIYTIGFTAMLDADGAAILRAMADITGGAFYPAQSAAALVEISKTIDRVEPSATQSDRDYVIRDWSAIPLAVALLVLGGLVVRQGRE